MTIKKGPVEFLIPFSTPGVQASPNALTQLLLAAKIFIPDI
jgi:hypothetical protein